MTGSRRYDVGLAAKIFAGLTLLLIAFGIAAGYSAGRVSGFMFGLRYGVFLAAPAIAAMVVAGLSHLLTKSAVASWVLSVVVLLAGVSWLFLGLFDALSLIGTG